MVEAVEFEGRVVGDHASVHQYDENRLIHHKEGGQQGESALIDCTSEFDSPC